MPWRVKKSKVMLIINPHSGQESPMPPMLKRITGMKSAQIPQRNHRTDITEYIVDALKKAGINPNVVKTKGPSDTTQKARQCAEQGYETVIAAGGDGTVNAVINGLANTKTAIGVIPLGTANVFAIQMGIPVDVHEACRNIASGKKNRIDLGLINDRYFGCTAGVGFDAFVIRQTRSRLKRSIGTLAYVSVGLSNLLKYPFQRIKFTVDDNSESRYAYIIIIGNGKYYGGELIVAPEADVQDGKLDVCIFRHRGIMHLLSYLWGLWRGTLWSYTDVDCIKCKSLSVFKRGHHPVHVDGEYYRRTPVRITAQPGALYVIGSKINQ
ncbi:MAG: YegS/Rv2252/BmrU family lipid kinase [Chitinivibrionales bacterium]|nr:YegS/Rv2252/BmrU family lipid kinase [Chitinivibrionales bacterium]